MSIDYTDMRHLMAAILLQNALGDKLQVIGRAYLSGGTAAVQEIPQIDACRELIAGAYLVASELQHGDRLQGEKCSEEPHSNPADVVHAEVF